MYLEIVRFFSGRLVFTFKGWYALTTLTAITRVDVLKPRESGLAISLTAAT